jgi:hypothetical protein
MLELVRASLASLLLATPLSAAGVEWCAIPPPGTERPEGCLLELGRFPLDDRFVDRGGPRRTITESEIGRRYGDPVARRAWTTPDPRHRNRTQHHLELTYDGLLLHLAGRAPDDLQIEHLRVTDPQLVPACQIHVGAPMREVDMQLRQAGHRSGPPGVYHWDDVACSDTIIFGYHATIRFDVGPDGTVSAIYWHYFTD